MDLFYEKCYPDSAFEDVTGSDDYEDVTDSDDYEDVTEEEEEGEEEWKNTGRMITKTRGITENIILCENSLENPLFNLRKDLICIW